MDCRIIPACRPPTAPPQDGLSTHLPKAEAVSLDTHCGKVRPPRVETGQYLLN